MVARKSFIRKNLKKKVKNYTEGFAIKLITTIISGLFLSQTAVANDDSIVNVDYGDIKAIDSNSYIYTGKSFDEPQEFMGGGNC